MEVKGDKGNGNRRYIKKRKEGNATKASNRGVCFPANSVVATGRVSISVWRSWWVCFFLALFVCVFTVFLPCYLRRIASLVFFPFFFLFHFILLSVFPFHVFYFCLPFLLLEMDRLSCVFSFFSCFFFCYFQFLRFLFVFLFSFLVI